MLNDSPLGKQSPYIATYTPELLFPILRQRKREEIGVPHALPFRGVDIWNAYELSWLNLKGKPQIALAEFDIPCTSPYLIESKSLKLYFNSLNQSKFASADSLKVTLEQDLSRAADAPIQVKLILPQQFARLQMAEPSGTCLDDLDIATDTYETNPNFLKSDSKVVEERLFSNLLKSNCLVTGQPDWGTVWIHYAGPKIDHAGLLKYLISFRNHIEFHEQCVERIFMDITRHCQPKYLAVYARYTRRGGLDINPFRTNWPDDLVPPSNMRHCRQ